jgi:hypothetical protein
VLNELKKKSSEQEIMKGIVDTAAIQHVVNVWHQYGKAKEGLQVDFDSGCL